MIQRPSRQRFSDGRSNLIQIRLGAYVSIAVFAIVVMSAWTGATRDHGLTAEDMNVVDRNVTPGA